MGIERRPDPISNDGKQYTLDEFIEYYGKDKGMILWEGDRRANRQQNRAPRGPRGPRYEIGSSVRALVRLEGDRNQVVKMGAIGKVTALPGANSTVEHGAVAEVIINGVRFDAQPDMIAPADRPAPNTRDQPRRDQGGRPGPAGKEERRKDPTDPKGPAYSLNDFISHYGKDKGTTIWKNAGRPAEVEKRSDPSEKNGKMYTREEFIAHYGPQEGGAKWRDGAKKDKKKVEKPETRHDPSDPNGKKTYTREEFIKFYGEKEGAIIWKKAGSKKAAPKPAKAEAPEKRSDPSEPESKKTYTKKEFLDLYGEKKGTNIWKKAGKALATVEVKAPKKADGPEKRPDPSEPGSKKTYTKKEFLDLYGEKKGANVWKKAGKAIATVEAKAPKKADGPEKRSDPSEPESKKTYTKKEFLDLYGEKKGTNIWKKAGKALASVEEKAPKKADGPEKRPDPSEPGSKKTYTKKEFLDLYGEKKGANVWKKAGKALATVEVKAPKKADGPEKRSDPNEPESKKTYTKKEFLDLYGEKKGANIWKKAGKALNAEPKEDKRSDPNEPDSKKTYTKKEFLDLYGEKKGAAIWKKAGQGAKKAEKEKAEKPVKVTDEKKKFTLKRESEEEAIGWSRDQKFNLIDVDEDSVAAKAGLTAGLRVLSVNGTRVNKKTNIPKIVKEAGLEVELEAVEVRKDSNEFFTRREFSEYYAADGEAKWAKAGKKRTKKVKKDTEATEEKKEAAAEN